MPCPIQRLALALVVALLAMASACVGDPPCGDAMARCDTANAQRCHPERAAIQTCLADGAGCLLWSDSGDCGPHDACDDVGGPAACVCQHECLNPGGTLCSGTRVVRCDTDPNGCLFTQPVTDCAETGQSCDEANGAECAGSCVHACASVDATRCSGSAVQRCGAGDDGCRRWSLSVDCASGGQSCDESSPPAHCVAGCSGDCDTADATRCVADAVQVCRADGEGCLRWQAQSDCAANQQVCVVEGSNHLCQQVGGSVGRCGLCLRDDQCAGFNNQYGGRFCQPLQSGDADRYCLQDCMRDATLCGPGESCDSSGNCVPAAGCGVTLCSSTAPNGACAPGLTCQGGRCLDAGACSTSNQSGTCPAGLTCQAGSCVQTSTTNMPIGGACFDETQCATADAVCYPEESGGQPTGWVQGYCMLFDCATSGCPAGASCMTVQGGSVCVDECLFPSDCRAGYTCTGSANGKSICEPGCDATSCPTGYLCQEGSCAKAPCTTTPNSCDAGDVCVNGRCVADIGSGPGRNTAFPLNQLTTLCPNLPAVECTGGASYCNAIIAFEPVLGPGYDNYPLNGETSGNQYRSYLRRDLVMLIKYASAYVDCLAGGWSFGNGGRLGLGDMSEANGAIPGTSVGEPGHPDGTHTNGFDLDVGYFQVDTPNNQLRPVCAHTTGGQEAYHCTAAPYLLDPWRSALFLGALHQHPHLRVVGADGKVGPMLESAFQQLCSDGWLKASICSAGLSLAYEETDQGHGWFLFHHHHMHVSLGQPNYFMSLPADGPQCLVPGCRPEPWLDFLGQRGLAGGTLWPLVRRPARGR